MDTSSSRSELEAALGDRHRRFQIETRVASYTCCGKPWRLVGPHGQVYFGFVSEVTDEGFMLTNLGIGTITYQVRVPWSAEAAITEIQ